MDDVQICPYYGRGMRHEKTKEERIEMPMICPTKAEKRRLKWPNYE